MKKRLLVVDDEKYILQLFSEVFKSEDVEVAGALNGEEALAYIKKNDVDVVVTDIVMPNLNGIELFYEIKKINPFTQIIMVTGYPSIQNIVEMFEAGASDFIIKPFDLMKVKDIIKETFARVERWHSLREEWLSYRKRQQQNAELQQQQLEKRK